jgi:hypothetical protein
MDAREHLVAAGGQGEVIFWDRRAAGGGGKELGRLDDTHLEDVTQVNTDRSCCGGGLLGINER